MIIVKIELHSAVDGRITELGRLHIANDGTGTDGRGNYDVTRYGACALHSIRPRGRQLGTARVENHPRMSSPVWALVRKALEALGL